MNVIEKEVNELVFKELNHANGNFPLFHSPHEGYAVIKEEVEETMDALNFLLELFTKSWQDIKKNKPVFEKMKLIQEVAKNVAIEAIQTAAMCEKYSLSLEGGEE